MSSQRVLELSRPQLITTQPEPRASPMLAVGSSFVAQNLKEKGVEHVLELYELLSWHPAGEGVLHSLTESCQRASASAGIS